MANEFKECTTYAFTSQDTSIPSDLTCSVVCQSYQIGKHTTTPLITNQQCMWTGLSDDERNRFNGTAQDIRFIDAGACQSQIINFLTGGYTQVTCFCC